MTPFLSGAAVLIALLVIYRIMLSSGRSWSAFNPTRAQMPMRRPTGGNALLLLAAVNVATLGYQLADQAAAGAAGIADAAAVVLPALILVTLAALMIARSLADLLLGLVGVASALIDAYLDHGAAGALIVLTLTMLIVFLLGTLRGIIGPRR